MSYLALYVISYGVKLIEYVVCEFVNILALCVKACVQCNQCQGVGRLIYNVFCEASFPFYNRVELQVRYLISFWIAHIMTTIIDDGDNYE